MEIKQLKKELNKEIKIEVALFWVYLLFSLELGIIIGATLTKIFG